MTGEGLAAEAASPVSRYEGCESLEKIAGDVRVDTVAALAQLVEQEFSKLQVAGSNPVRRFSWDNQFNAHSI